MNLLIIENNSFLKDNFFFQDDLKKNFNLFFSSSIVNLKKIIKSKKLDFIIVSAFKSNSFDVINDIFKKKPKIKIIQILEKKNDYKHDFSSYFIKKPISINKLLLLLANFKKKNVITKKIFDLKNGLVFKKLQRKLLSKIKKKEINLTEKECDILNYLIKEKKLIKKTDLLKNIWGFNNKVKTRTLETHIYRLRKKINKNFGIKKFILVENNSYKLL
tara:strand:- start:3603 stop:4253 length:651 start_codon:yes stop_codon:yes gene_type:complete